MTLVLGVASLVAAWVGAILAYNHGWTWIVLAVALPVAFWALWNEDVL